MKILVLHGPNMNLIGLRNREQITLDKINSLIKKELKKNKIKVKIFQTNSQSRGINIISQNRNKCIGIIIAPESWRHNGHGVMEALQIINKPYVCIHTKNDKATIMEGAIDYIYNKNILTCYKEAIRVLCLNMLKDIKQTP